MVFVKLRSVIYVMLLGKKGSDCMFVYFYNILEILVLVFEFIRMYVVKIMFNIVEFSSVVCWEINWGI